MLVTLYDALIGKPGAIGALEEFRASMKALGVRIERLEDWEKAHLMEHQQRDQDSEEARRTLRGVLLGLAERAIVALAGAAVALGVAFQTFLQGGHPPAK